MGPIEKKIIELSQTEGLSEETKLVLVMLKNQVKELEPELINRTYQQGYHDKEVGKRFQANHYSLKYHTYVSNIKVGELV